MTGISYDYDLIVIGGGSGGMAASKEAAKLGLKVALFDFVKPTVHGTKWGIGGTCVNVGCIPKKLMHYSGLLGAGMFDAKKFGWQIGEPTHDWGKMVQTVQNYIKQLNFGYKRGLRSAKVEYINALASFASDHEVEYELRGEKKIISGANIIIAVGGRPIVPSDVPGAQQYAITSDDIFSLKKHPGRTLVVGGSYIALECAGFLNELGIDVTVAVRSIILRGFDRQCSEKIAANMVELGVQFAYHNLPSKIEKLEDERLKVTFADGSHDLYDTVLYAVGRRADTDLINLDTAKIIARESNGKLDVDEAEKTCVDHIYAIGDVIQGKPELTPVAIQAGEYLARRIAGTSTKLMDYVNIPTAVFTPYEYGTVGYSQEEAIEIFGKDNLEVYLFEFGTLEFSAAHREKHERVRADEYDVDASSPNLSKLICNKNDNERVVGFHFIGPNAGEICQGFALGIRLGATKADFNDLVGIHPTDAESFTAMDITEASGESFTAAGGCGGGKCG